MASQKEQIAELKLKYIEYYKELPVQKYAAMYVGKTEDTIINWRRDDSDFSDKVDLARAEWVRKKASKAKVEFALERLEKQIFKETKEVELTTPQPILGGISVQRDDRNDQDSQTPQEN